MVLKNKSDLRTFLLDPNYWDSCEMSDDWNWEDEWAEIQNNGLIDTFTVFGDQLSETIVEVLKSNSPIEVGRGLLGLFEGTYMKRELKFGNITWLPKSDRIQSAWVRAVAKSFNSFNDHYEFKYGNQTIYVDETNMADFFDVIQKALINVNTSPKLSSNQKTMALEYFDKAKEAYENKDGYSFRKLIIKLLPFIQIVAATLNVAVSITKLLLENK